MTTHGTAVMAKQAKPSGGKPERIELRADIEWVRRVLAQAERFGLSLSAYIRDAVTRRLEQDEATDPNS